MSNGGHPLSSVPVHTLHSRLARIRGENRHDVAMVAAVLLLLVFLFSLRGILEFAPDPIAKAAPYFAEGAWTTVLLTLVSGSIGLGGGMAIGVGKLSRSLPVRKFAEFYVWVIRGTPLIVQILFVYFALPNVIPGLSLDGFWSAVLALSMNTAAYNAEIIRAGIQSVPRGQTEAAKSLGMPALISFLLIVLPQAIRVALPPLVNNWVALLKDSSLAYVIGVVEVTMVGNRVQAESFQPVPVFITSACIYLALTTIMGMFANALEARNRRP